MVLGAKLALASAIFLLPIVYPHSALSELVSELSGGRLDV